MTRLFPFVLLLGACTLEASIGSEPPPGDGTEQVALVPVTITNDLDLLFVIDDSPSSLILQQSLKSAFPAFVQILGPVNDVFPDLHVGVVSTDLGTSTANDPQPGPGIGSGPGSCTGYGKDGVLQASAVMTSGNFLFDRDTGGGVRERNYTGSFIDALTSISALGSNGCGFEQPLQAALRAASQTANVGFLRQNAPLAIIVITNEDDCSLSHSTLLGVDSTTLGPLQSFRCTRFGVTCDDDGRTTDEMNKIGPKGRCHANPSSELLANVTDIATSLKYLKHDPRNILFGAIAGAASPVDVELRLPPGGGAAIPSLAHSCTWSSGADVFAADPAVRVADLANEFTRHQFHSVCGGDMATPMKSLAREMRGMMGRDACLTRDIKLPAECSAMETHGGGIELELPQCNGTPVRDCWRLVDDAACPGQGLRMDFVRLQTPAPDVMTALRCKV